MLRGSDLQVTDFYDLENDPDERENLAGKVRTRARAEALIRALWSERGAILAPRGADRPLTGDQDQAVVMDAAVAARVGTVTGN